MLSILFAAALALAGTLGLHAGHPAAPAAGHHTTAGTFDENGGGQNGCPEGSTSCVISGGGPPG